MRLSTKRAASAVAALALVASVAVGLFASVAVAAKPLKPGRVIVSADVLIYNACSPSWVAPTAGHIEVNAVDLDTSIPEHSWSSQNDRMTVSINYGGTALPLEPARLEIFSETDAVMVLNGGTLFLSLHDGGNPGVLSDWLNLNANSGTCARNYIAVTGGNVNISPAGLAL